MRWSISPESFSFRSLVNIVKSGVYIFIHKRNASCANRYSHVSREKAKRSLTLLDDIYYYINPSSVRRQENKIYYYKYRYAYISAGQKRQYFGIFGEHLSPSHAFPKFIIIFLNRFHYEITRARASIIRDTRVYIFFFVYSTRTVNSPQLQQ